ncbi:hypothetical protein AB6D66_01695 [Vibrio pomeroyi]|uniref:Uncharacterized protein n=1 Tax=Vibrio pomeroyi TaxID=198832 RepID=A0ABV4MRI9_9VIBR|nr:hypothetical protein [Vibrio atlanticus]MCZ4310164.1 hypothetical protein [Vibrio atlanticus]
MKSGKNVLIKIIDNNQKVITLIAFAAIIVFVQLIRNWSLAIQPFHYVLLFFPFIMLFSGIFLFLQKKDPIAAVPQAFGAVLLAMLYSRIIEFIA